MNQQRRRAIDGGMVWTVFLSIAAHVVLVLAIIAAPNPHFLTPGPAIESYTVELVAPGAIAGDSGPLGDGLDPFAEAGPEAADDAPDEVELAALPEPDLGDSEPEPVQEAIEEVVEPEPIEEVVEEVAEPEPVEEVVEEAPEPEPVEEVAEEAPEPEPVEEVAEPEPVEEVVEEAPEPELVEEVVEEVVEPEPVEAVVEEVVEPEPVEEAVAEVVEPEPVEEIVEEAPQPVERAAKKVVEPKPTKLVKSKPTAKPTVVAKPKKPTPDPRGERDRQIAEAVRRRSQANATDEQIAAAVRRRQQRLDGGGAGLEGPLSTGPGDTPGGGVVLGAEYVLYKRRMETKIRREWVWAGNDDDLVSVVRFSVTASGEVGAVRTTRSSGDRVYDRSAERAVQSASPLGMVPPRYRREFADVEMTFRARDRLR